jgi:hypothetical protein
MEISTQLNDIGNFLLENTNITGMSNEKNKVLEKLLAP